MDLECPLKASEFRAWSPEMCYLEGMETLRGKASREVFRSLGHALEGDCGPLLSSSLLLLIHEMCGFALPCVPDMMCCHRFKARGAINHGLKLPKL